MYDSKQLLGGRLMRVQIMTKYCATPFLALETQQQQQQNQARQKTTTPHSHFFQAAAQLHSNKNKDK